jgi:urease accessory protein
MKTARSVTRETTPAPTAEVVLDFQRRQKHRFLTTLGDGRELGVHLPRGTVLSDGDLLRTEDGETILVRAADEEVSVAETSDALLLTRVAYHLGNRHVALQIEPGRVSYLHDHVLDDMVQRLGAKVSFRSVPFRPEPGAYGGHPGGHHGHGHGHEGDHDHGHGHEGEHDHSHGHQHSHPRIHDLSRDAKKR